MRPLRLLLLPLLLLLLFPLAGNATAGEATLPFGEWWCTPHGKRYSCTRFDLQAEQPVALTVVVAKSGTSTVLRYRETAFLEEHKLSGKSLAYAAAGVGSSGEVRFAISGNTASKTSSGGSKVQYKRMPEFDAALNKAQERTSAHAVLRESNIVKAKDGIPLFHYDPTSHTFKAESEFSRNILGKDTLHVRFLTEVWDAKGRRESARIQGNSHFLDLNFLKKTVVIIGPTGRRSLPLHADSLKD